MDNTCRSKKRPPLPTVKNTIKIINKTIRKPSVPTINETVSLNKPCNQVLKRKLIEVGEKSVNSKFNKNKIDLLQKKKVAEEQKKKLDKLQITTKELTKAPLKSKIVHLEDKCKIGINLPLKSIQPEVDLKLSHPLKILKTTKNVKNKLLKDINSSFDVDRCSSSTTDRTNTIQQTKIIEKEFQLCDVTKPQYIFDKLILNDDDYQLINTNSFDNQIPKIINTNTSLIRKDQNNDFVKEMCDNYEKRQNIDNISLNKDISNVNLGTETVDSVHIDNEIITNLTSLNKSHEQIIKNIEYMTELQKLLFKQNSPKEEKCSESTQTNNYNNLFSSFTSKTPPPPMNFISVLKCKNNLQQTEKKSLEFIKPKNLNVNEYSILNNLQYNKNKESFKVPDCDKIVQSPNLYLNKQENDLNEYLLIEEKIKSKSNGVCLNQTNENNVCENKTSIENTDKLFTKSDILSNDDIKQFLKQRNYNLELLTKNSCDTNDLHNTSIYSKNDEDSSINKISQCFPEIHEGVQAELDTINQLNKSLCDIEKMSCDMSIKINEQSINDVPNGFNLNTILNSSYSNNDKPSKYSKLNAISTNMISMDKTINGFSIQMFEQLIKDEELRAKQHQTILCLREKSLINRLKWEITMYDLQIRNLKNRPIHEKQLQLFKQKQRGSIKKLEHSLFQIKQLGRVIDSVYKKRLTMLEEHLQHLRMQSSSKKVIRKIKSLDQISKKEDWSHKQQFEISDLIDTIKNEHVKENPIQFSETTPPKFELDKYKVILQNQATSPINIGTMLLKEVKNVEVQTNADLSLKSTTNKIVQTSNTFENLKSIVPIDFLCINESSDINIKDKSIISPILLTNSDKLAKCFSKTSIDLNSEYSDMDIRITTLQEQLEARKLESERLKKEQKILWLENLKAKEKDLLKEIELYDKKIEESKKSLMVEIQKKNIQVIKSSLSQNSKYSNKSILQNKISYTNSLEKNNQHINKTMPEIKKDISFDDPASVIHQKIDIKTKNDFTNCTNKCDSVKFNNYKLKNQTFQFLKTNQMDDKNLLLHRQTSIIEDNTLKKSHDVQTEINKNENDKILCEKKQNYICQFNILKNAIRTNNDDSSDFTSDESISEFHVLSELNKYDCNIEELLNKEENKESSYEEEKSEGDIMIEDKIFIEHYSNNDLDKNEHFADANIDIITNSIFNCLLKDTRKLLNSKINRPLLPLEKNEEEYQNMISCSEQATSISDNILKHHLLPLLFKTVQMYLSKLNKFEIEKLTLYLKWSSKRKKIILSEFFNYQYKTSNDDNNESFEMFYQKYQDQMKCSTFKNKSNNDELFSQNQQEVEKLKLKQIHIEAEIERLCMSKGSQLFFREIPNKPPPPYKSPTKNKAFVNMPSIPNKIHEIVLEAASHLYNKVEIPIPNNNIIDLDSRIDYSKEIVQNTFIDEQNVPIRPKLKQSRIRSANHKVLSDIIEVEECEENVDTFIVKQMYREDNTCTNFQIDKMELQNKIVQNLMKKLISNTITNIKTNYYSKFII